MNKLIIIHIDGFSYEYINNIGTPFLETLNQSGLGRRMAPSIFFQSNLSTYTGKEVLGHGRMVEYIFDPDHSPFKGLKRFSHSLDRVDRVVPEPAREIWRYVLAWFYCTLAGKSPVKLHSIPFRLSSYFSFCFNESYLQGEDIFFKTRKAGLSTAWDDEDFTSKTKRRWLGTYFYRFYPEIMVNWAIDRIKAGINLIWVDLGAELDKYGHKYGPRISGFLQVLKKIDRDIEKLVNLGQRYNYNFIIFSDHGMEEVKGSIDIAARLENSGLRIEKDYIAFYDSTIARFWIRGKEIAPKIKALLANIKHGIYIDERNRQEMGIPPDEAIGEIFFAVEQGWIILPNFYQGNKMVRGMHGYLGQRSGPLDGLFISDLVKRLQPLFLDNRVKLKDIAQLSLKTMGIK